MTCVYELPAKASLCVLILWHAPMRGWSMARPAGGRGGPVGRRSVLVLMASGSVACGVLAGSPAVAQPASAPVPTPEWSAAQRLPGLNTLDVGKSADAEGLSCSSAG